MQRNAFYFLRFSLDGLDMTINVFINLKLFNLKNTLNL